MFNTDQVWAEFNIDQRNGANIHVNDQAQVIFNDGTELLETKVSFIQPFLTQDESFIKVRIQLSNEKKKFQVGQLVKALFKKTSDGLWIPRSARLDLGLKKICFVKRGSVFYPIEIITARQSDDWIEVLQGVNEKDSLASNAQFMIDSESFIKVNN